MFIALTVAGIINAFGVTIFLFPVKLYDSGISGLSMLLDQVTPSGMTLSLFLLLLNIPIFAFGLRKQGIAFTVYSMFTVGIYSLTSFLIELETSFSTTKPVFVRLYTLGGDSQVQRSRTTLSRCVAQMVVQNA